MTKAYREPSPRKAKAGPSTIKPTATTTKEEKPKVEKLKKRKLRPQFTVHDSGRKTFRKSTALKSAATQVRLKERQMHKKRRTTRTEDYIPTQEELLEEVSITELENLRSLERFKKLELEKKKTRPTKRVFTGPIIRYHSMTMPQLTDSASENASKGTKTEGSSSDNKV